MLAAALHPQEEQRLLTLQATGLLDSPADPVLDAITSWAARALDVPICLLALIDQDRQFFKANTGLPLWETPRDWSFCAHAILCADTFTVPDARADPRFADNPLVSGPPGMCAYAGATLRMGPDDLPIGTLCVIETRAPRQFTEQEVVELQTFAALANAYLMGSVSPAAAKERLLSAGKPVAWALPRDSEWTIEATNARLREVTGFHFDPAAAVTLADLLCLDRAHLGAAALSHGLAAGLPATGVTRLRRWDGPSVPCDAIVVPIGGASPQAFAMVVTPARWPSINAALMSASSLTRQRTLDRSIDGLWTSDEEERLSLLLVRTPQGTRSLIDQHFGPGPRWWQSAFEEPLQRWATVQAAMQRREPVEGVRIYLRPEKRWYRLDGWLGSKGYHGVLRDITDQVNTQQQLNERAERFRMFAELGSDWSWEVDAQMRLSHVDQRIFRHTGLKAQHLLGQPLVELPVRPADRAALHSIETAMAEQRAFSDVELCILGPGAQTWTRLSGVPLRNASGEMQGFRGIARNSARGRPAHELFQQTADSLYEVLVRAGRLSSKLPLALEGANFGFWVHDLRTGAEEWSAKWHQMLGYQPGELRPTLETLVALMHPEDLPHAEAQFEAHRDGKQDAYRCEFRLRHRLGHWVWVACQGSVVERGPGGEPLRMAGTHLDISAQVAQRQRSAREQQQLLALIDDLHVGLLVGDMDTVAFGNRRMARLLGLGSADELVGLPINQMLPQEDQRAARSQREFVMSGNSVPPARMTLLHLGEGHPIGAVVSCSPIQWNGQPHVLGMFQPTDEQGLLRLEADATHEGYNRLLLKQLESAQERIARELHDSLGSELTGISLLIASLKAEVLDLGAAQPSIESMLDHALAHISRVADMTRSLARGLSPVVAHAGGLVASLHRLVHDYRVIWRIRCDVEILPDAEPTDPYVSTHLYRIAQEAVNNAVRHGKSRHIRLYLFRKAGYGVLRIEDDGRGFDPRRVSLAQRGGIGLQSIRARTHAIDGELVISSSPGGGSSIEVVFPDVEPGLDRSEVPAF